MIKNADNIIVGVGYNGMPRGCHDDRMPWGKSDEDPLLNKYFYVCHAEMNAIANSSCFASLKGCTMYVTLFPCNECAKLMIQVSAAGVAFPNVLYIYIFCKHILSTDNETD